MDSLCNGFSDSNEEIEVIKCDWEEISVDIGWGCIRGKKYGSGDLKILGVHGWLDNANTFDRLVPLLAFKYTFISIDLPGHGYSDHFPPGFIYEPRSYVAAIQKVIKKLEWKKFTYFGHSMGAVVGILYASVFPENIENLISIDIIKPWSLSPSKYPSMLRKYYEQYFEYEQKSTLTPFVYKEEELITKIIEGTKSLDKYSAAILAKRGAKKSLDNDGFILTRDLRAKAFFIGFFTLDAWIEIARSITCPILLIKALQGHFYENPETYALMLSAFKENCSKFIYKTMDGKHHIHLTEPSVVAKFLNEFLESIQVN